MRCPKCQSLEDRVIDSRSIREGMATRRRRECVACGMRFTTYEYIEAAEVRVIKRDRRIEPYSRDKLTSGIQIAFAKRPITETQIEELVERIEQKIIAAGVEISSLRIGEFVMKELSGIDDVAYIRFASVYKRFRETGDFHEELNRLNPADSAENPTEY
ncbi:MAG: transcriptional regulator NrdR [bacterium]|nr:transcriptional regulator NrdR [bacterium]